MRWTKERERINSQIFALSIGGFIRATTSSQWQTFATVLAKELTFVYLYPSAQQIVGASC